MASIIGQRLKLSIFGESHGEAIGCVLDGLPAGEEIDMDAGRVQMARRAPGTDKTATTRRESDTPRILSGVCEGSGAPLHTTGAPLCMVIENESQRSGDYANILRMPRPGHADYTFDEKYGFRDYRGGGRSSGRETIGRVAAGAIAAKLLESLGVTVTAYARSIGPVEISMDRFDLEAASENKVCMPDREAAKEAESYLEQMLEDQDSVGGVVECVITGLPAGIGEPVFEKLDARLAHAEMSVGAVKGVEIGDGFEAAKAVGSVNNDDFCRNADGTIGKRTNHSGGILGGMSDGSPIVLRAAFKPTPSISRPQQTVNRAGEEVETVIKGRHDPIIVPRAVVVVETMAAFTAADLMLQNAVAKLDNVRKVYER